MSSLPKAIIAALRPFAGLFSRPVWAHVQVLLVGALLGRGPRTVAAVLQIMGCRREDRCFLFQNYGNPLADTGSRAPDNCTGLRSPGRDDPRSAPVSADQGSIGLSRPATR
jgi:hypothetical protein